MPGAVAGARGRGQTLAVLIGSIESTEIGSIAWTVTGDEETHGVLRDEQELQTEDGQHDRHPNKPQLTHIGSPFVSF
jgi:hypothetical protein